jgi:hypothetical protein
MEVSMKIGRIVMAMVVLAVVTSQGVPVSADEPETETICITSTGWDMVAGFHARPTVTWSRLGQRLTIPDRRIVSIGYRVARQGYPVGDVILSIRDSATDEVIASKVWGCASELDERGKASTYHVTVEFARPVRVRGDVRISVEFYDGDEENYVLGGYRSGNVRDDEVYTNYHNFGEWGDIGEAEEGAYCYTYLVGDVPILPPDDEPYEGGVAWAPIIAAAAVLIGIAVGIVVARRKRGGD